MIDPYRNVSQEKINEKDNKQLGIYGLYDAINKGLSDTTILENEIEKIEKKKISDKQEQYKKINELIKQEVDSRNNDKIDILNDRLKNEKQEKEIEIEKNFRLAEKIEELNKTIEELNNTTQNLTIEYEEKLKNIEIKHQEELEYQNTKHEKEIDKLEHDVSYKEFKIKDLEHKLEVAEDKLKKKDKEYDSLHFEQNRLKKKNRIKNIIFSLILGGLVLSHAVPAVKDKIETLKENQGVGLNEKAKNDNIVEAFEKGTLNIKTQMETSDTLVKNRIKKVLKNNKNVNNA